MKQDGKARRRLVAGLGAAATAVAMGTRSEALGQRHAAFEPARHTQDDWMDALPGTHRVVLDVTSPDGVPDAIRFAGNLFTGHQTGYDVPERDLAIIIVLRHSATAYGYADAIWSKYGKSMGSGSDDPAAAPPTANPYDSGERRQLSSLAKRGVHFIVCGSASLGLARRIAGANGNPEATIKEMVANLIPNSHITVGVAGVVPVAHAQERGYSYLYVG
jgi:intracellular sulfur oxidation DsrE/DsrF family protein